MYKIIYQQNLEKDDFHNLNNNMLKKLLSFYRGVEIVKFSTCPGTSKWP